MNAKVLYAATVALALIASTAAMASDATQFNDPVGTRSRADVKAELAVARAGGQLTERGESYGAFQPSASSTLSRAAVMSDLARDRATTPRVPTAVYGYFEPPVKSVRTREEVRAEARAAVRNRGVNTLYVGG